MPSLTAHLVTSGDHGRLGFHPDCPVCRQGRLFGSLNSNAVVSPRAKAALASGVLAFSAVGPAAAMAQEPDLQLEGGSEGAQTDGPDLPERSAPLPPDETSSPPVPEPTPAPDLASPSAPGAGEVGSDLDDAPVDREPVENQSPPAYPPADPGAPDAPDAPDDPADYQPEAPAEPGAETAARSTPGRGRGDRGAGRSGAHSPRGAGPQQPPSRTVRGDLSAQALLPPVDPGRDTAAALDPGAVGPGSRRTETGAQRHHPGPRDHRACGGRASAIALTGGTRLRHRPARRLALVDRRPPAGQDASPARIARKVSQLWTLNEDRIGTGRPDLLLVGTKLRLR